MKVPFGMVTGQTTGFGESLLRLVGPDREVPDFSTVSRRRKTLKIDIPCRGSWGPLHLPTDIGPASATGSGEPAREIRIEGEGAWNARRHGGSGRRVWRRIHIGIAGQTLEIRAARFSGSDARRCTHAAPTARPDRAGSRDRQRHRRPGL